MFRSTIDGESSQGILARIIADRGPLLGRRQVPPSVLAEYETILPPILLDFWENHGLGGLSEGRIRFVLPPDYAGAVARLFAGDPDFAQGCHAIAIGPFGEMMIWSQRHKLIFVGLPLATVDAPFLNRDMTREQADRIVLDYVLRADPAVFDTTDDTGEPMFQRARAALGPLNDGEIYGTVPALTYDEPVSVDALHRVIANDWLSEKFSGTTFQLVDIARQQFNIRPIGPT